MSEKTDEQLVAEIRAGNKDLYGVLVERYEEKLTRYGRRFLSDSDDIGDTVQDVFIKAYVNINSFDVSRSFSSWIYRIAHNEYVNVLKKKKISYFSLFEFDTFFPQFVATKSAYDDALTKEKGELVEKALKELEPKYKEPILLYFFEEKSYEEISDIMQIPKATVGVRIMRGKQRLQEIVSGYDKH